MGGKPNPGTKPDKRLKDNSRDSGSKPASKQPAPQPKPKKGK